MRTFLSRTCSEITVPILMTFCVCFMGDLNDPPPSPPPSQKAVHTHIGGGWRCAQGWNDGFGAQMPGWSLAGIRTLPVDNKIRLLKIEI